MRSLVCLVSACLALAPALAARPARADDTVPAIVLYELSKQHSDAAAAARRPQTFWVRQVAKAIGDAIDHADVAKRQGTDMKIGFTVAHDGHLVGTRIVGSSGDKALDAKVLALVAKAAPFPPMPDAFGSEDRSFVLPVRFH